MEGINPLFKNNYVSYPSNFTSMQKTPMSVSGKTFFQTNETEINKEISMYLDILYNNSDEEVLSNIEKLKLNSAYSPMKTSKIDHNNFFI